MSEYDEVSQDLSQGHKGTDVSPLQAPMGIDERESHNVAWLKHNILTLG